MLGKIFTIVKKILKFILAVVITLIVAVVSPIAFALAAPFYIFRFVLIHYAKHFRPDLGNILTTRSAVFVTDDLYRKPKANIILVSSMSGEMDVEKFRNDFLNITVLAKKHNGEFVYPELRQNVCSLVGFPFWKWDENFKIEEHILEHPGKETLTPDLVNKLCTKYLKTPFLRGQSPWKIYLFPKSKLNQEEKAEGQNAIGVMIILHHSLADGFSILKATLQMGPSGEEVLKKVQVKSKSQRRNSFQNLCFSLGFLAKVPYEFVMAMIDSFDMNECHLFEGKLSENVYLAFSERIPLEYVKDIKQSHGVSLTAVLLAGFTGAVRRFMLENELKVPNVIHSVTPFPMPGHSEKLRNFMTTCFIRLPIGLPTPEERLLAIEENLSTLKNSTQPITMFYIVALLGALPTFLVKIFFKQYGPTALISNFPGPQEQIRILGLPLEDIMFTAGLLPGRIGIGFDALSYNGNVRIQAAFNEALSATPLPRTFMLEKVLAEIQDLSQKHNS